jgi:hypothetical protein
MELPIRTGLSRGSSEKFVPVMVTIVPPRADPVLGVTAVTRDSVVISRLSVSSRPSYFEKRRMA